MPSLPDDRGIRVGPAVKREGVAHLQAVMGLSERRACSIVSADRKIVRYRSCRAPDTELRTQLRDLANERKRFGYRRLFVLLRQEGEPSGINRIRSRARDQTRRAHKREASRGHCQCFREGPCRVCARLRSTPSTLLTPAALTLCSHDAMF